MARVSVGMLGQAVGLFAITNVDDIVLLALFFAQGAGHRHTARNITAGQYLGFAAILAAASVAASGASLLPEALIPYLGLLPLALGVKAAVELRLRGPGKDGTAESGLRTRAPKTLEVAAVTLANGGDNIGVYVPVFATAGLGATSAYLAVFLALVAVWVAAGWFLATRPMVAGGLSRFGHLLLPIVLMGIGCLILIEGGAFGL